MWHTEGFPLKNKSFGLKPKFLNVFVFFPVFTTQDSVRLGGTFLKNPIIKIDSEFYLPSYWFKKELGDVSGFQGEFSIAEKGPG